VQVRERHFDVDVLVLAGASLAAEHATAVHGLEVAVAVGRKPRLSTFNADVEVAAPGVNILSTWKTGGYVTMSGTSMATPAVAGVAAIIAGRTAGGPSAWREKLDRSVDDLGPAGRDTSFGFGRVNLRKAVTGP
jgi:subtilisin family serine protease